MKAGRELDALIAEKVMDKHGLELMYEFLPHYSTNIEDAWKVVDKFKECDLQKHESDNYTCYITEWKTYESDAKTAPLAICLAALRAVGYEV